MAKNGFLSFKKFLVVNMFFFASSFLAAMSEKEAEPSSKENYFSSFYDEILQTLKQNKVEVRRATKLKDVAIAGNSLEEERGWKPQFCYNPIQIPDGQYALLKTSQKVVIIKGPFKLKKPSKKTRIITLFEPVDLASGFINFQSHALVTIEAGQIGFAKSEDGNLIALPPGFHHLKDREQFFKRQDLSIIVDTKDNSEKNKHNIFRMTLPGNFTVEKIEINDSNIILIGIDLQGKWHVLKNGLKIYPPCMAINEPKNYIELERFTYATTSFYVAQISATFKVNFTSEIPTSEEYTQYSSKQADSLPYAKFLASANAKMKVIPQHIGNNLAIQIQQFAKESEEKYKMNLSEIENKIKDFLKGQSNLEQNHYLRFNYLSLICDAQEFTDHIKNLHKLKWETEINDLKMIEEEKTRKIKQEEQFFEDERYETKTEKQFERDIKALKINIKNERLMNTTSVINPSTPYSSDTTIIVNPPPKQ